MLDAYLKWFESHERILIVAMVLIVGAFGINKWLDKSAMDASNKAAVAEQIAAVQHDADVKIAAAVAQQTALFNQEQQARDQQMATLVAAVASRDAASNTRVETVKQPKTSSQAVVDLQTTYQLAAPVTVTDTGAEVPTVDIQQFTVAKIEGDTAKADLNDTKKELSNSTAGLQQATILLSAKDSVITGLNTEIKTDASACDADKAKITAVARKSKWHLFWWGFGAGFIGRQVIGSKL